MRFLPAFFLMLGAAPAVFSDTGNEPGATALPVMPPIQPTLSADVDYRLYPSDLEGNSGFALARLRPGVVLAPRPWFRAVGTIEYAGESAVIYDAYMRLRAADWLEFTLGYSKTPLFASFIYEPDASLPFPDRAPVVTSFSGHRDLGADAHFTPRDLPLEAWIRIGNGNGSTVGNDNALPAGYASLDWVTGRAHTHSRFAAGSFFGLRLGAGGMIENNEDRDGITAQTPLGFTYFRPVIVSGLRRVGEAHAIAYAGPARFTVEAAMADESRSQDNDGNPSTPRTALPSMQSCGITAEIAWSLRGRWRAPGEAPRGDLRAVPWDGGALEVSARYDGLWLGRGARDVQEGGSQGGELGVKWWPTEFLAATLAGTLTRYDQSPIEEPDRVISWGAVARGSVYWGQ